MSYIDTEEAKNVTISCKDIYLLLLRRHQRHYIAKTEMSFLFTFNKHCKRTEETFSDIVELHRLLDNGHRNLITEI